MEVDRMNLKSISKQNREWKQDDSNLNKKDIPKPAWKWEYF